MNSPGASPKPKAGMTYEPSRRDLSRSIPGMTQRVRPDAVGDLRVFPQLSRMFRELLTLASMIQARLHPPVAVSCSNDPGQSRSAAGQQTNKSHVKDNAERTGLIF
jgi:hypothetical protein